MKLYFSGFCLENEEELFQEYKIQSQYCVSGFSYGAQKAFEHALESKQRIDTLQLFSPAFFQDKDEKYKRMQLMFFNKNPQEYCKNFLQNCQLGSKEVDMQNYFVMGSSEELQSLLYYEWDKEKLQKLLEKNIKIEVYLGSEDKIIDSHKAKDFFKQFSTVYFFKNKGHIL